MTSAFESTLPASFWESGSRAGAGGGVKVVPAVPRRSHQLDAGPMCCTEARRCHVVRMRESVPTLALASWNQRSLALFTRH